MTIRETLLDAVEGLDVVDVHEQMGPEADQLREPVDVFTLFADSTLHMAVSAGMTETVARGLSDTSIPLEKRWEQFEPFYKAAYNTGPMRTIRRTLAGLFETTKLSAENLAEVSERVASAYRPGLYRRILLDECGIETCVNLAETATPELPSMKTLLPIGQIATFKDLADFRSRMEMLGQPADLTDYVAACGKWLAARRNEGAVGLKALVERVDDMDQSLADALFRRLKNGDKSLRLAHLRPLRHYLLHEAVEMAGELDMVVVLGCGTGSFLWEDMTQRSPQRAIGLLSDHRQTRFDLLVAGLPWMRSSGALAARFPNVSVNLSITPVLSEQVAAAALGEWLDLVPGNKIIAFGGNHRRPVPNIYGHLMVARRVVVETLARKIDGGDMDLDTALETARALLQDNARNIYGL